MITLPNGKICMNEQEAIAWLLDNYPIPFQCSANYVGGAEIGLGTIVNPTPAKVKVGSIIFFADSKVSTVIGVNSNSFICSDEYNDLVDDVVYVTNVAIDASGHLITTLSNGNTVDAGLIKQVTGFSINASQHLIVSYNDGTTTDLGAIFQGNITISGSLTAAGNVSAGNQISAPQILEIMTGYSFTAPAAITNCQLDLLYASVVKTGNKITFVVSGEITRTGDVTSNQSLGAFNMPSGVCSKLIPSLIGSYYYLDARKISCAKTGWQISTIDAISQKVSSTAINMQLSSGGINTLDLNTPYFFRYELTFLLSDSLI